jgi:hypothetical protein
MDNNITKYCNSHKNGNNGFIYSNLNNNNSMRITCFPVQYNKLVTGGNDPTITKKMRYSQIINNNGIR